MFNTVTLFSISDEIIYNIEVYLEVFHNSTQDEQNSNQILCKSEIHHNSPYFAITTIPVIYNENIINSFVIVKCNKNQEKTNINNSVMYVTFGKVNVNYYIRLLNRINPTKNDLDEDIDMLLKLILSKTEFTKIICDKYREMDKFSLRGNTDLEFKYLLFSFKNNGSLYEPSYYFNYTMKLLEFIRREHNVRKFELFPFLRKFVFIVLNYFRSDGLYGPHAALSFYLYYHFKIHVRCLPFDLTFDNDYQKSDHFYYMNFSLIENSISLTSQLALIWGYQSKRHNDFMECVRNLNIKSQYGESFRIMELRLRESAGASKEDFANFTKFSREFFPSYIGAHPLSNQLLDYPISLTFIHDLMRIRPLVSFPKDEKEVVKFALPSSTLANVMIDEYINYPKDARYDFSNPQVAKYRDSIAAYFKERENKCLEEFSNMQNDDIHQLHEPIITTFYGITSLYITQFTNQYDFSKVDLHDLLYISVSKNNPYFTLKNGILYRGYNFNTGKMRGRDQNPCSIILAARDILSAVIPKSVTCISESAFANCSKLERVIFEKNSLLKTIKERAFFECKKLKMINFEDTIFLKEIENNAFQYSGLEQVNFKESQYLIKIGEFAFSSCKNLKTVTIPGNDELSIKSFAFYQSPIEKVTIFDANSIYEYAFAETNLNSISLPDTLSYIGAYAFDGCRIKSFTIPSSTYYIPSGLLAHNNFLQQINVNDDNCHPIFFHQHSIIGMCKTNSKVNQFYSNIKSESQFSLSEKLFPPLNDESKIDNERIFYISPKHDFKNTKLRKSITKIKEGAFMRSTIEKFDASLFEDNDFQNICSLKSFSFAYMHNLRVVDLEKTTIDYIPEFCFFHSKHLYKVRLPATVKIIGRFAFAYTQLHIINLHQLMNLTRILDYAFYNTKIKTFIVPPSVEYLGSHFYSNSFFKIDDFISEINPRNDDASTEQENEYDDQENDEDEDLKEDEEEEEDEDDEIFDQDDIKFDFNQEIKEEEIINNAYKKHCKIFFMQPSRLKEIECYAFYKSNITEIELPSSLQNIGSYAFSKCKIEGLTIPRKSKIRRIPDGFCFNSNSLFSFDFDDINDLNNINYIGSSSFTGTRLGFFRIPPNVSFLTDYCFYNTKIKQFQFHMSLKLHEIKHKTFNYVNAHYKLPLSAIEIEEDSFLDSYYEYADFIGNQSNRFVEGKIDFSGYDEIALLANNEIDIMSDSFNPYKQITKDELEIDEANGNEGQQISQCIDTEKSSNARIDFNLVKVSDNKILTQLWNNICTSNNQSSNAVILLYYEIASKQITHISLTYSENANDRINSVLLEIDHFSKEIHGILFKILDRFKLSFIRENDIDVLNDFFGFNFKSVYSPSHLYEETLSLCKELKPKISKNPPLLEIERDEIEKLTALTTISCIYLNIKNKIGKLGFKFKDKQKVFLKLRLIAKDDYFEMSLFYSCETNTIITKQFLTDSSLTANKSFDGFIYLLNIPRYDNAFNKISVTYNFSINYLLRDILDNILKGKLKPGEVPFKPFLKFSCMAAYFEIFSNCESKNYQMADISSKTLILNDRFIPVFIFIQHKPSSTYNIDLELKRLWLLLYELITNQNIDDLMKKVEQDQQISFDNLKIKIRSNNEFKYLDDSQKEIFHNFINNVVYQVCFNFDKFGVNKYQNKKASFSYLYQEFKTLWNNSTNSLKNNEKISKEKEEVDSYFTEISNSKLKVNDIPDIPKH